MSRPSERYIHLGIFSVGTGSGVTGWRMPGASVSNEDIATIQALAATAERGKFDFVFVSDNLAASAQDHPGIIARLEPFTLLAALSATTHRIGLVGTASATYTEPYNLARLAISLDHISRGRAGWNIVTSSTDMTPANFGKDAPLDHDLRYRMADEFLDVVTGLWDSWDDGARIADRERGVYMDTSKLHVLDHVGQFYKVRGPLNSSRCPQGWPVLVQAGASASGQAFAARWAEVIFTVQHDMDEARAFYQAMKRQVIGAGRNENHLKILPGIVPVVARTEADARAKVADMMRFIDDKSGIDLMSHRLGFDLSPYPLDGPIPPFPKSQNIQSYASVLSGLAKRPGTTLRDLYNIFALCRGQVLVCGTPTTVADYMQEWLEANAADGFMIFPATLPASLDDFVNLVVPELQRRGLFRSEYAGATLRDHLGLPRPLDRTSARATQSKAQSHSVG